MGSEVFNEGAVVTVTGIGPKTFKGTVVVHEQTCNCLWITKRASNGVECDSDLMMINLAYIDNVVLEKDVEPNSKVNATFKVFMPKKTQMTMAFDSALRHRELQVEMVERNISSEGRQIFMKLKSLNLQPEWLHDNTMLMMSSVSLSPPYRHAVNTAGKDAGNLLNMVQKAADKVFDPTSME